MYETCAYAPNTPCGCEMLTRNETFANAPTKHEILPN